MMCDEERLVRQLLIGHDVVKSKKVAKRIALSPHRVGHLMSTLQKEGVVKQVSPKLWHVDKEKLSYLMDVRIESGRWDRPYG